MSKQRLITAVAAYLAWTVPAVADELRCDFQGYRAQAGLTADLAEDVLTVTWNGDPGRQVRLRLAVHDGTPTFDEIAVHDTSGVWTTVAAGVTPEFRVVTGVRRMTEQQLSPLRALDVAITPEVVAEKQWDAFWDAPLDVPGMDGRGRTNVGMPRTPDEIQRATATWDVTGCTVATHGGRLEVAFPGLRLGLFSGRLQMTVYRGTSLMRTEAVARTDAPSVAYKYEAGLSGFAVDPAARVVWRDLSNHWQDYQLGGAVNDVPVPLKVANRVVIAETARGAIAAFPPRTPSSSRARSRPTSATGGIAETPRRSPSACARRKGKRTRVTRRTSRSTARAPAPGSAWRSTSMSERVTPPRRSTPRWRSLAATVSRRCRAIR